MNNLKIEIKNKICILSINRLKNLNAINLDLLLELKENLLKYHNSNDDPLASNDYIGYESDDAMSGIPSCQAISRTRYLLSQNVCNISIAILLESAQRRKNSRKLVSSTIFSRT